MKISSEKKPTAIMMHPDVYRSLKVLAVTNGLTLNDAIKMLLDEHQNNKGE